MKPIDRVKKIIEYHGLSVSAFEKKTGMSNNSIQTALKRNSNLKDETLNSILNAYPEINPTWLLTGRGEMFISGEKETVKSSVVNTEEFDDIPHGAAPYWNLPVSAGHSVEEMIGGKKPNGYIKNLPGIDLVENILPVSGMSMEPEISNGAIIGVRKMNNWESLNTERVYMILTHEDRMIKRIEPDIEDSEVLWCVSPNYPKFKIYKTDIIEIQRVCFVYNPK